MNPPAYREFLRSGRWPERSIFVMESRAGVTHELLANTGTTQGQARSIEASVKDSSRFPATTWAYFDFGNAATPRGAARQLPPLVGCNACHAQNTAVENTFVQFYPVLMEAARRLGTVKPTYDPMRKF